MNATNYFKKNIQAHLDQRAEADPLFAIALQKEKKSIDDCITYILNWVRESGCIGFTDDEIYSQAVHYYDEDSIEIGRPINCKVVVNHAIEISENERQDAKEMAIRNLIMEEEARLRKARNRGKKETETLTQLNLF